MELTEVMRTTGSIRLFRPDPVPDHVIHRVLDSARFAPSGGNRQGWRVIVVRDRALQRRLSDLYVKSWDRYHAPLFKGATPGDAYARHLAEVPIQLVVVVERAALVTTNEALDSSNFVGGASIYPFVHNIALALRAEGLGTTISTVLIPVEAEAKQLLDIPDGFAIAAHLGVGWPAQPFPERLTRRQVEEFATVDAFSGEPFRG